MQDADKMFYCPPPEEIVVGTTVFFRLWISPFEIISGEVIEVRPDMSKATPAKYIIRPLEERKEIPSGLTSRYYNSHGYIDEILGTRELTTEELKPTES